MLWIVVPGWMPVPVTDSPGRSPWIVLVMTLFVPSGEAVKGVLTVARTTVRVGMPVPWSGSPTNSGAELLGSVTESDPCVSVPVMVAGLLGMIWSAVELGIGSVPGLSDDSAVIWVRPATFAWTLESRNALVVLLR